MAGRAAIQLDPSGVAPTAPIGYRSGLPLATRCDSARQQESAAHAAGKDVIPVQRLQPPESSPQLRRRVVTVYFAPVGGGSAGGVITYGRASLICHLPPALAMMAKT